jgi:ABC-type lipoprotein release transport system permease subunit
VNLLPLAARNLGRNRRRTAATLAASVLAGSVMIVYLALMEGIFLEFEQNALGLDLGEIQIHAEGYRDDPDLYARIPDPDALLAELAARDLPAAPRLFGFALAAAGSTSTGVRLRGVDVAREKTVTSIHQVVDRGSWLDPAAPHEVVVGRKVARILQVGLGDEIVILGQAADGSLANDLYSVRGILGAVGDELDRTGFLMTEGAYRSLMGMPEGVHEIAIARPGEERSAEPLAQARDRVAEAVEATGAVALVPERGDSADPPAGGDGVRLEVLTWRRLVPILAQFLDTADVSFGIMMGIMYVAIGMVLLNAMLMSVFERVREFGVMKALGLAPRQVAGMIFLEAALQAGAAAVLSLAVGLPLALWLERTGIDFRRLAPEAISYGGISIDPIWNGRVTVNSVVSPIVFLVVVVMLAVIYPAVKAAVIRPVQAIHHR